MTPQETLVLEQKVFIKGHQKFEIRPDGELDVFFKRFQVQRQFQIPLWRIISRSERHKFQQSGPLVGLLIFMSFAAFLLWGMIYCFRSPTDKDITLVLAFPFVFFVVLAWLCLWRLKTQSINAIIFHLREGGQIHVWFEKPNAKIFHSFCETLSKKSEEAWLNHSPESTPQGMAGEIAALKKLKDMGILTEAEFERAKAKLLEHTEEKRIGFNA